MSPIFKLPSLIFSGQESPLSVISKSVGITGTFDTGANLDVDTSAEVLTSTDFDTTQGVMITADSDNCLLYTSPSPRDRQKSRMPSSA